MAAKQLFLFLTLFFLGASPAAEAATLEGIDRLHDAALTTRDFEKVVSLIKEGNRPALSRDEWAWRLARAYFRLGKLSGEAEARAFYNHCLESAKQAIAHNGRSAPGYFYKGLCTGKKGELEGLWKSLGVIEPFKQDMETALKLDPGFDHGGPNRALAKLYLELPFFLGGDLEKSLDHIQRAVESGPVYEENYLYLAEVYFAAGKLKLARQALAALKDVAAKKPASPEVEAVLQKSRELEQKLEGRETPGDPHA